MKFGTKNKSVVLSGGHMDKKKAVICTALYVVVLTVVLTVSSFVKNEEIGIDLYNLIIYAIAYMSIGDSVTRFYNWLKE